MIYNAEDKWNNGAPHLEHRSHKYYMKIGEGPNARYFYSAAEYAAYRTQQSNGLQKRSGEEQMRELRQRQANRLNKLDANKERVRSEREARARALRNKTSQPDGPNRMSSRQQAAELYDRKKRADRQAAFDKARADAESRGTRYRESVQRRRQADAFKKISEKRRKHDAAVKARNNEKILPIPGATRGNIKRLSNKVKYGAKNAYSTAKKTANTAYKSAKKAYNSKQGKTVRKKVKRTAQSAYNKGTSFIKKLFNR